MIGQDLGEEFLVIAKLAPDVFGKHFPHHVIGFIDGAVLVGPVRVNYGDFPGAVDGRPENQEAKPAGVEGQVFQAPLFARGHFLVIEGIFEHPVGRALEDCHLGCLFRQFRYQLKRAGAGSDDRDALTFDVRFRVPVGGVKVRTAKGVQSRYVRNAGSIELTHGADKYTGSHLLFAAVRIAYHRVPAVRCFIIVSTDDLRVEAKIVAHRIFIDAILKIGLQLGLLGKKLRPVVCRFEGIAVEVVGNIHPGAGVAVLEPGAAHGTIFLEHGKRNACL